MADISKFKVYITEPYFRIGRIYCILTGMKYENSSYIDTEWHYYLKDKNKKIASLRYSVDGMEDIEQVWKYFTLESLKDTIYFKEIVPILDIFKYRKYGIH